ncbi:hypothetical protein KJ359_006715 [Pestalotiopsis sp. 9143b]|nr:hypothetical protein KJ359_006715 [Pestalotiopsis sp. 9143b]
MAGDSVQKDESRNEKPGPPHNDQRIAESGGAQPGSEVQRRATRIRWSPMCVLFITFATMSLRDVLRILNVPDAADVTLIVNYFAMLVYMIALHRAGELIEENPRVSNTQESRHSKA